MKLNDIELEVINCRRDYRYHWRVRGLWYWYWRMFQEFVELGLSLAKLHKHLPDLEARQISAIGINFIEHYRSIGGKK